MAKVINGVVVGVYSRSPEYNATQPDEGKFIQTSYNVYGGVYINPKTGKPADNQAEAIAAQDGRQRKNFAGIGFTYDKKLDAFIPPTPYPSWKLNKNTCLWEPPIPYPYDSTEMGGETIYIWDELKQKFNTFL
jgi:hypothetical protein